MAEDDFREQIRVAQFWRHILGDRQYLAFDPDDLYRWYGALELRGPVEIRRYIGERRTGRPMPHLLGLVGRAPHPPMTVVELWLDTHETVVHTRPFWLGLVVFVVLAAFSGVGLSHCAALKPIDKLISNPPGEEPLKAGGYGFPPPPAMPAPLSSPPPPAGGPKGTHPSGMSASPPG